MTSVITLPWKLERAAPPFEEPDIKYPESLVRHFLKEYTKPGGRVFDPFAGLGTTLFVAEETGRVPYGIEHDAERHQWVAGQLENWTHLIHGDSAHMNQFGLPRMDFCMTSPPYMPRNHQWNPLYGGDPAKAGYTNYLKRMTYIFKQLSQMMKRNARVVVQVDNITQGRIFTPLVWDIGQAVSKVMRPENDIVVQWKNGKPDYPCTHCLVFRVG